MRLQIERRLQHPGIKLAPKRELARAVHRALRELAEQIQLLDIEIIYYQVVGGRVEGRGQHLGRLQVELPASHAQGVKGSSAGELGGDDTIVLAESVRSDELAAKDCASCGGCKDAVDLVADLGRDGLECVVMRGHCCCGCWGTGS